MRALLALALLWAPQEGAEVSGKVAVPEGGGAKKSRLKLRYVGQTGLGQKKDPAGSPSVVWLEGAPPSRAEGKHEAIVQEGLEFRPRVLAIQVGTTVRFPNLDNLYHNVFSYSAARRFDLGRYPHGESKEVTFDRAGRVDVFCEIHEHMRAFVVVVDNPHFARAEEDGRFSIPRVPPGRYTLVAWREGFEPVRREVDVGASGARVDVEFARRSDEGGAPRLACCGAP
jgi:plastocyanin